MPFGRREYNLPEEAFSHPTCPAVEVNYLRMLEVLNVSATNWNGFELKARVVEGEAPIVVLRWALSELDCQYFPHLVLEGGNHCVPTLVNNPYNNALLFGF